MVAPGADPKTITLAIGGVYDRTRVRVDREGSLVVPTNGGEVRFRRPVAYQQTIGKETRNNSRRQQHFIDSRYVLRGKREVGFEVAAYDASKPLIIDPVLSYSTYLGGSGNDNGNAIAVDGNAYVTGETASANFPTLNPFQAAKRGGAADADAFVTKLNAAGSALIYSTYLGGTLSDFGTSIAVDLLGRAHVTGATASTDFPTVSPFQAANAGGTDAFITKLNAAGNGLIYSTYLGGSLDDVGTGIALGQFIVGGEGAHIHVTGSTLSTNFPTASPRQAANAGGKDAFVTKIPSTPSATRSADLMLLPPTLTFATQAVGQTSTVQTVTLTTRSDSPLYIANIVANGDFAQTSSCPLAGSQPSCSASFPAGFVPLATVAYITAPNAAGDRLVTGSVNLQAINRFPLPNFVNQKFCNLVQLAPDLFVEAYVPSAAELQGDYSAGLLIDPVVGQLFPGGIVPRDRIPPQTQVFAWRITPSSVKGNCAINVTFMPTATGTRTGTLTITDSASGSPHTIALSGTGAGPNRDFSLASSPTSAAITAGQTATYTLTIAPSGGFNQTVALACSGAPQLASCSISPGSVTPDGSNPATATVTVTTTARSTVLLALRRIPPGGRLAVLPWIALLMGLGLFAKVMGSRQGSWQRPGLVLAGMILLVALWAACGGGSGGGGGGRNPGTPAGTYTLAFTGTSGDVNHTATASLTVN